MAKSTKKDAEIAMDRRTKNTADRRNKGDRRKKKEAVADERRSGERRQKVQRRRQIDPTTCERDYTNDEIEFMQAMDDYKRRSGRMFPTCSEILEVIRDIGYMKATGPIMTSAAAIESTNDDGGTEDNAEELEFASE